MSEKKFRGKLCMVCDTQATRFLEGYAYCDFHSPQGTRRKVEQEIAKNMCRAVDALHGERGEDVAAQPAAGTTPQAERPTTELSRSSGIVSDATQGADGANHQSFLVAAHALHYAVSAKLGGWDSMTFAEVAEIISQNSPKHNPEARAVAPVETPDAKDKICAEIQDIMRVYREQEASAYGVDTPGGLEHMGDVWSLLSRWDRELEAK